MKREFDVHRDEGTPHPYMTENGLSHMVPLDHSMMDEWRENFKGVRVERHGLQIFELSMTSGCLRMVIPRNGTWLTTSLLQRDQN